MIVDSFTHIIPAFYLEKILSFSDDAIKKAVDMNRRMIQERPYASDPIERVELLKKYNIDYQVVTLTHNLDCNVLPFAREKQLDVARSINDGMAQVMEQSQGKLVGIAAAPLFVLEDGGLEEMERAIKGLGLKGFCLPSNSQGKPVDDPEFALFWAKVAEMGVPVFIHPTDPQRGNERPYEAQYGMINVFGWPFETVLMLSRLIFSGILEKYPDLEIVSHHLGGGMVPFLFGRIEEHYVPERQEKEFGRVLSRPVKELFRRFYYDTAVGDCGPALKCCSEVFGSDRMLFSTDFPYGPKGGIKRLESYQRTVRECGIPAEDVEKVLGGNAKKLFGI